MTPSEFNARDDSFAFHAMLEPIDAAHRDLVALKVGPLALLAIRPKDAALTEENLWKATGPAAGREAGGLRRQAMWRF